MAVITLSILGKEGGKWQPFVPETFHFVHAIRFSDGSVWDTWNGFRPVEVATQPQEYNWRDTEKTDARDRPGEKVNHPSHYGGDTTYEVIKVLEAWALTDNAMLFNVVKYVARAKKKGNYVEDLKKALWYLQREIDRNTPTKETGE